MKEEVVDKVRKGYSYNETSQLYGISKGTVVNWCKERNVESVYKNSIKESIYGDIVEKVIIDVQRGETYDHISKTYGIGLNTVVRWCKKRKVQSCRRKANVIDERIEYDIVELIKNCSSYSEVARMHMMDIRTVKRICKKYNLVSVYTKK